MLTQQFTSPWGHVKPISPYTLQPEPFTVAAANSVSAPLLEQRLRQQLARELHDGPVQLVSNAAMNLMVVQKHLARNPEQAQQELSSAVGILQRAIQDMRAMLFELRPMVLESEGLVAAVQELSEHLHQTTALEIDLELDTPPLDLTPAYETNIYYIIQEAIQNIVKHASAKRVQIRFTCIEDELHISIRDDGNGFDLEQIRNSYKNRKSLGLINLYERAQLIGGRLSIDALQGRGTTIRLTVPLERPLE